MVKNHLSSQEDTDEETGEISGLDKAIEQLRAIKRVLRKTRRDQFEDERTIEVRQALADRVWPSNRPELIRKLTPTKITAWQSAQARPNQDEDQNE